MIAQLLLGLLADVVFESVVFVRRSFREEMNRYMEQRGLAQDRAASEVPAR